VAVIIQSELTERSATVVAAVSFRARREVGEGAFMICLLWSSS
jgi:hypothetical protein